MNKKKNRFTQVLLGILLLTGVIVGVWYYENNAYGPLVSSYKKTLDQQTGELNALDAARDQAVISSNTCDEFAADSTVCKPLKDAIDESRTFKAIEKISEGASRDEVKAARTEVRAHIQDIENMRNKLLDATDASNNSQRAQITKDHAAAKTELQRAIKDLREAIDTAQGRVLDEQVITNATDAADNAQKALDEAFTSQETNEATQNAQPADSAKVEDIRDQSAELRETAADLLNRVSELQSAQILWEEEQSRLEEEARLQEQARQQEQNQEQTTPENTSDNSGSTDPESQNEQNNDNEYPSVEIPEEPQETDTPYSPETSPEVVPEEPTESTESTESTDLLDPAF